jgi:hypothetical protein
MRRRQMPEKSDVTHDEIAKPLQRDDILGSLEDARAGQRVWRDLFDEGPKTEDGWRWPPR